MSDKNDRKDSLHRKEEDYPHTFGTQLAMCGVPVSVISKLMGHRV